MSAARDALHPQIAALLAGAEGALATVRDPARMRAEHDASTAELSGPGEPVATVEERDAPVRLRIYAPEDAAGTVLYLHGGGWVMGSLASYDPLARALANASGARLVLVDYRLAPEHRHPAALEDAEAALGVARELGGPVAVAGDSAGGQLAAVLARRHPDLAAQALVYPVLDAGMATASYRAYATGFRLTAEDMAWCFAQYLGAPVAGPGDAAGEATAPVDDPDVSPLRAPDLAGLPPATILLASHDVLRDEGEAYARRLRAAGVRASVTVYDGTVHGFARWLAKVDAARAAVAELGGALRAALRQADEPAGT